MFTCAYDPFDFDLVIFLLVLVIVWFSFTPEYVVQNVLQIFSGALSRSQ